MPCQRGDPQAVEEIGADVPLDRQRVGGPEHEVAAVQHVGHVVRPQGGAFEEVPRDYLVDQAPDHGNDEPGKRACPTTR